MAHICFRPMAITLSGIRKFNDYASCIFQSDISYVIASINFIEFDVCPHEHYPLLFSIGGPFANRCNFLRVLKIIAIMVLCYQKITWHTPTSPAS